MIAPSLLESSPAGTDRLSAHAATVSRRQSAEALIRIRTHLPALRAAEQRVAHYVLSYPADSVVATIADLARSSGTSPATVSKFCRSLGYPSLAAFRRSLATDLTATQPAWEQVLASLASLPSPALESCRSILLGIYNTFRLFDPAAVARTVEWVAGARHVLLVGSGGSGIVAGFIAQKLVRLGIVAIPLSDPSACRDHLDLATADDLLIAISHRGETAYVVEALCEAQRRGVRTVVATQRPGSRAALLADICLLTSAEEPLWPGDSTRGRLATMALFDALHAVLVASRMGRAVESAEPDYREEVPRGDQ